MSAGSPEEIDEERRLLDVAMTRAKRHLLLIHPIRFYRSQQQRMGDAHVFAPLSRFVPDSILDQFEKRQRPDLAGLEIRPISQAHQSMWHCGCGTCGDRGREGNSIPTLSNLFAQAGQSPLY